MIVNGGSYRNVRWWADHLQAKENDRTCVVESYGLRSETIHQMLSEMEGLAQGTRCENFFYQMNLNPRGNERLTEEQWSRAREIAEKHHGLEGQAYFVVEHVKNDRVHHHIVWSRIDLENMRAISDSKDARKNHAIAREVEKEFDLQRVTGPYDREPGTPRPKRAPEPWEMYRGMKTGLDPRDIAAEVTELFRQSDSGKAFQAALEQHGYMLLKGDRRGFVILDSAGKEHSLARRIDNVNTKDLNAFMHDVNREALPTVEQGKARHQELKIAGLEADRATVQQTIAWEEELAKAAIEKEKTECRFVEKGQGGSAQQQHSPAPAERTGPAHHIHDARQRSDSPQAFITALAEHGIELGRTSRADAVQSQLDSAEATIVGRWKPTFRETEIVAVTGQGQVWKLNERTTGDKGIQDFLSGLDMPLASISDVQHQRRRERELDAAKPAQAEPELNKTSASIRLAYNLAPGPEAFRELLQQDGLTAARLTAQDIQERDSARRQESRLGAIRAWDRAEPELLGAEQSRPATPEPEKRSGTLSDHAREGDIVILDRWGNAYELTRRTTGDTRQDAQAFVAGIGPFLPSLSAARRELEEQRPVRVPTGPLHAGLVAQQMWALRRVQQNADERWREPYPTPSPEQRRVEERYAQEAASKATGEVDPQRYLTDPDYRRQVRSERSYKTSDERKAEKENDLRAMLEQQDRQR